MKKIIIFLNLLLITTFFGFSQNPYRGEIKVDFKEIIQNKETITLRAMIDLTDLNIGRNEIITFIPALRSLDGTEEIKFDEFSISGRRRAKSIRRDEYFSRQISSTQNKPTVITRKNNLQNIPFEAVIPFEKWMRNSQLVVVESTCGCCNDSLQYADGNTNKVYKGTPYIFKEPYQPVYTILYVTPPYEEVKIMQETYSAQLNFHVNKTELLRQFGNNAKVLAEVDEIIDRTKKDTLLTMRKIIVRGYASPEGSSVNNQKLSEGRAKAFVDYLHERHNFYKADRLISAEGLGEDWIGLRKAIEAMSYFDDKTKVLDVIDNNPNTERRKTALKALSAGRTYKMLLEEVYPPLRRNEYTIEYEVRGFNVEEAKAIFKTRPQLLSLNEMFMVANTYEHDSEEYKQVFDVAARLYPDSPIAQLNVGAMEIENGSYDTAIRRLEKINSSEALNNLAIAFWYKGEYEKAKEYFLRALELDDSYSRDNLLEYEKWFEDKDD